MTAEEEMSTEGLTRRLTADLPGKCCTLAWLGYAEVLFVGLAEGDAPEAVPDRKVLPPVEIQAHWAGWSVWEGGRCLGSCSEDRSVAERAAVSLQGRRITGVRLGADPGALTVTFEGELRLEIAAWPPDAEYAGQEIPEAWLVYRAGPATACASIGACSPWTGGRRDEARSAGGRAAPFVRTPCPGSARAALEASGHRIIHP